MLHMKLPFPPSVNNYWLRIRNSSKLRICPEGIAYRKAVKEAFDNSGHPGFGDKKIVVMVYMYPEDNIRRDVDNFNKCLLDSMSKAKIWTDDCQSKLLCVHMMPKEINTEGKHIHVTVEKIPDNHIAVAEYKFIPI